MSPEPRTLQGPIVRALKPLIFEGIPVVFIAIPHRRYDAVRVEREMTGRIQPLNVPAWSTNELVEIANVGFPKLRLNVSAEVCKTLANEAYGSPHLMQEFCKALAQKVISQGNQDVNSISANRMASLFKPIAQDTGRVVFDKLAKGPRQRTDRIARSLKSGGSADIYRVVLLALAKLGPGLDVVDYETLRTSIREILTGDLPQAHEVTRVLEKMAEIAAKDQSSVSVLDWDTDDRRLHITDPFFAFFLKWSVEYIQNGIEN